MFLAHREVSHAPGAEVAVLAALTQASVRGVLNLVSVCRGEMSRKDAVLALARDSRNGVLVWVTCKGVLKLLTLGELNSSGTLGLVCGAALRNPAPVMFGVLSLGLGAIRGLQALTGDITPNQLRAELVLLGAQSGTGILVSTVGRALSMSCMGCALFTMVASCAAGMWAHELWRASRQQMAEERLCWIAREILGLAHGYTSEDLRRRWRQLALVAHPDKNRCKFAKQTFAVFSLCRDVLLDSKERPVPPGAFFGLRKRLRRMPWARDLNLPPLQAVATKDTGSKNNKGAGRSTKRSWNGHCQEHRSDCKSGHGSSSSDVVLFS